MKLKNAIIYKELEEELRDWMQPFAGSVRVAKSFKNEGEQEEKQEQKIEPEDPFAGVDLENVPDDVKARLTELKVKFANLQSDTTKAKTEKEAVELQSRQHQARADKFDTELRKHNLHPTQQQVATGNPVEDRLTAKYVKELQIPEAQARIYAKMNAMAYEDGKADILKTVGEAVGPHIQAVGTMSVDRLLNTAAQSNEYGEVLQNEYISAGAKQILNTIVASGGAVDQTTIDTAIKMATGEALMSGKYSMNGQQQQQQQQQPRTFGGNSTTNPPMRGPSFARNTGNGAPIAKNDETGRAATAVADAMRIGLKGKK